MSYLNIENYERRQATVEATLAKYGFASLEAQLIKPLNATARTAIPKSFFIFIPPIFFSKKTYFLYNFKYKSQ